ncbi:hypothetical protein D5085_17210 [Ectothiorhodospiraceae bacterium BW-2]|nr:hypothetical protein D5085_17210 [Ectothiorhodospiraceae bacterium BW-2]
MGLFNRAKAESSDTTEQEPHESGLTLGKINLIQLLLLTLLVLFAAYLSFLQYASQAEKRQQAELEAAINQSAFQLQGRIAQLKQMLTDWIAYPEVATELQRMESGNLAVSGELEQQLRAVLPKLQRLALFDPNTQQESDTLTPPLGFACIDLAASAKTSASPLELHSQNSVDEHLDIALPLAESERRLVVTLPKSWLIESVQPQAGVLVQLLQQVGGQQVVIHQLGSGALASHGLMAEQPIGASRFLLRLYQPLESITESTERQLFLATFAVIIVLLWIVAVALGQVVIRLMRQDLQVLQQQVSSRGAAMQHQEFPITLLELRRFSNAIKVAMGDIYRSEGDEKGQKVTTERASDLDLERESKGEMP